MAELYSKKRGRPLTVKAYSLGDPSGLPQDAVNSKTINFIQNGQGFHNLMADLFTSQGRTWKQFENSPDYPYMMPEVMDPPLTQKGRNQAIFLQSQTRALESQAELIILSPLCRALQTGVIAFQHLLGKSAFVSHEGTREETGIHVCDKRRPTSQQEAEFSLVDFSLLDTEDDLIFSENQRESKAASAERI